MSRTTAHTTAAEPQPRSRKQAVQAAINFSRFLRVIDTAMDFSVFQSGQEVVVCRNSKKEKYPAIVDIMALIGKAAVKADVFEDVHLHFDGDSLSLFFTETSV